MQNKKRLILATILLISLAIGGHAVADENWRILDFYSPPTSPEMIQNMQQVFKIDEFRVIPTDKDLMMKNMSLTADDYVSYMLVLGYSNKQITANLKEKGYYWPDNRGYWDVVTPEPSSGKFVPDVPEWVGKDYRNLTPSPDSRERICWDDRPIPKICYEEGGYNFDTCYRMDLTSEQLAEFKRSYDNRCRNWDWDEYWVEYKADIDAGRR